MTSRRRRTFGLACLAATILVAAAWVAPKLRRRMDMQGLRPVTVARGLDNPWALAFLPDGRMLVTERAGRMRVIAADGAVSAPLRGLPPVFVGGEGGLMDVALDAGFAENRRLYWTFTEPAPNGGTGSSTAVARGRFDGSALEDVTIIFRQADKIDATVHYGSRLLVAADGSVFVGLGDRSQRADVQNLASPHGKILRMDGDGRAPAGNPFADRPDALPLVWTYGHRNVQGLARHPTTGELWATEHGPQGGDELNVIESGRNYGWPIATFGCEYETCAPIGNGVHQEGMEEPVRQWSPEAISPTGMTFLTSDRYPGWRGDLFLGMLQGRALLRLKIDGRRVVEEQELLTGMMERVRDVRQGPDGWLYVLVGRERGRLVRVER